MDIQYFKNLLKDRGLKATTPRLNVLLSIQKYKTAIPYSAIQESMQSMDRVTLYRTIKSLKEQGIIHKAYQENNEVYYAICGTQCASGEHHDDHIHFKCKKCDSVTCVASTQPVKISIPNYKIDNVSIHLEGVCNTCTNQTAARK